MIDLLEREFARAIGSTKIPMVKSVIYKADFALNDPVACRPTDCPTYFRTGCDCIVSKHAVRSHAVVVIDIEDFFKQFPTIPGRVCDRLLYDGDKLVLMDMTCSRPGFLEPSPTRKGKRATAYEQIDATVTKLCKAPEIAKRINGFASRIGLLAIRKKTFAIEDKVNRAMDAFSQMRRMHKSISTPMNNGFVFQTMEYPNSFLW